MIKANCLIEGKAYTHEKNALTVELCDIIYDKKGRPESLRRLYELGFNKVKYIEDPKTDTQCYVAHNEHSIVVVWRGSESKRDWQTNLTLDQTQTKKGKVHRGFYTAISSVFDSIREYITTEIPNYRALDLFTTGHSLGGALTTMFAYFFDSISPFEAVYAHASPRCFSKGAVKSFNKQMKGRAFRTVHNNDIVCRIPFELMLKKKGDKVHNKKVRRALKLWKYRHFNGLVYITSRGKVRMKASLFFVTMDRIWGRVLNIGDIFKNKTTTRWFDEVDDHHPFYYYNAPAAAAGSLRKLEPWDEYKKKK